MRMVSITPASLATAMRRIREAVSKVRAGTAGGAPQQAKGGVDAGKLERLYRGRA